MRVKDIMKKAITVRKEIALKDAVQLMVSNRVGCLVVTVGDDIAGIITERDALKQISDDTGALKLPVGDFMSTKVITVDAKKDLEFAAELMTEFKVKKLPVVDGNKLVGIITSTDLIANASDINEFSLF